MSFQQLKHFHIKLLKEKKNNKTIRLVVMTVIVTSDSFEEFYF